MTFTLRPYQNKFVKDLALEVSRSSHVIGQSPGGTGKTKVFLSIAQSAIKKGRAVLIMTDRVKVFNQIANESKGKTISDGIKHIQIKDGILYVAMIQTLSRRPKIIEQFNRLLIPPLVMVDEVHVSTCKSLLDKLTNRITIGFTATPDYRIAKHLPEYFNSIVCTEHVQWFIDNNYLCDYQHIVRKSGSATDTLKKNSTGDFSELEQLKFFGSEDHYQELFKDLEKYPFKKAMLFTASIKHAEEVYHRLLQNGNAVSIAHSKRGDESYQIAKFEELNETNILVSVGSLTTGYDNPSVDLIILYRATTSLALYLQMLFRADRPKEGMFFRCLDYGSNGDRHLPYNYPHPWNEMWNAKPKRAAAGVAGIKICPECDSMIFVSLKVCNFCGFKYPDKPINSDVGTEDDITRKESVLIGKLISQLTAKELALYANLFDKKKYAIRVAVYRDMEIEKNFLFDYAACMGYKPSWVFSTRKLYKSAPKYKDYMI